MITKTYENPVIGDKVVFLKTSEETNGDYSLIEVTLAPGGGNTLHYHKTFSETFQTMEGALAVQVRKEHKLLQPGESYTVHPSILHRFYNPSNSPIKFRVELRPGHMGFENSLKIAYGLAADGLTNQKSVPRNFSHLALLVSMSGTYPSGLFSVLTPIFNWKAQQARKQGVEKKLIEEYCR